MGLEPTTCSLRVNGSAYLSYLGVNFVDRRQAAKELKGLTAELVRARLAEADFPGPGVGWNAERIYEIGSSDPSRTGARRVMSATIYHLIVRCRVSGAGDRDRTCDCGHTKGASHHGHQPMCRSDLCQTAHV